MVPGLFSCSVARDFAEMQRAYALHGGLADGDQTARDLARHVAQPISLVARWIVERRIVCIACASGLLLPRFQFAEGGAEIRPGVRGAIAELADVFDDWEIARWFAQPNDWLRDRRPIELIGVDDRGVLHAARADRFVARG